MAVQVDRAAAAVAGVAVGVVELVASPVGGSVIDAVGVVVGYDGIAAAIARAAPGTVTVVVGARITNAAGCVFAIGIADAAAAVTGVVVSEGPLRAYPLFGNGETFRRVFGIDAERARVTVAASVTCGDVVGCAVEIFDPAAAIASITVAVPSRITRPLGGRRRLLTVGVVSGINRTGTILLRTATGKVTDVTRVDAVVLTIGIGVPATAVAQLAVVVISVVAAPNVGRPGADPVVYFIDGAGAAFVVAADAGEASVP